MVRIFTPAYGTALKALGLPSLGPEVFASPEALCALRRLTHQYAQIGGGLDAIATHTFRCQPDSFAQFYEQDECTAQQALERAIFEAVDIAKEVAEPLDIPVFGSMSVRNGCYDSTTPFSSVEEAVEYHLITARLFQSAGVDVLLPETVNTITEGIAFALIAHELHMPMYLSLVVDESGLLPSGRSVGAAIKMLDGIKHGPEGYFLNCAHRVPVTHAFEDTKAMGVETRLKGFYTNASDMPPLLHEKNGTKSHASDTPEQYAEFILKMLKQYPHLHEGWVSGCCGWSAEAMDGVAKALSLDKTQRTFK